jgi:uracil-DNA glycosylase
MNKWQSKSDALKALTRERRTDRLPDYYCIQDFHNGAYDRHDYLSPWSLSSHNENADILIFLQDWSSEKSLSGPIDNDAVSIGYTPSLPSNKNLIDLLSNNFGKTLSEIYITNLFVFIKRGGMSARIPTKDMVYCTNKYGLPLIDIIQPKMVICLGSLVYNSFRIALNSKKIPLKNSLTTPLFYNKSIIYGVSHTGGLGVANAGGFAAVREQWATLSGLYRELKTM